MMRLNTTLVQKLTQGGHGLWKTGKTGKMMKKNSLQGKIREFENSMKIREKSGNFENPVDKMKLVKLPSWFLVVSI